MLDFEELKASFDNFTLLKRGGQKEVFSAIHQQYGDVVVKFYFTDDARSKREIDINKAIIFDCVPKIFETGQVIYQGKETLFIIEQKVDGEELRKWIERKERFSLKEAVDFLKQGFLFIQQLENKNIIHRDIKPENIIISKQGKVFFLDFGIARILGVSSITGTGAVAGPHTPGYAAPEQFNNLKNDIDSRADLFSIGVVTYECVTGKNPFSDGATSHLEILQRTETVSPVTFQIKGDTQQQLMGLLSSLMGKFPSRRPSSATQALNWLNAAKSTFYYEETQQ
jgi:serine/threonine-protein kinase